MESVSFHMHKCPFFSEHDSDTNWSLLRVKQRLSKFCCRRLIVDLWLFNAVETALKSQRSTISYITEAGAPIHAFLELFLTSTTHNVLSKTLTAFPHNHRQNNGQWWERNESCRNDYHQSSAEPESNQRPPVLKSCTLPTEQWGSDFAIVDRSK